MYYGLLMIVSCIRAKPKVDRRAAGKGCKKGRDVYTQQSKYKKHVTDAIANDTHQKVLFEVMEDLFVVQAAYGAVRRQGLLLGCDGGHAGVHSCHSVLFPRISYGMDPCDSKYIIKRWVLFRC